MTLGHTSSCRDPLTQPNLSGAGRCDLLAREGTARADRWLRRGTLGQGGQAPARLSVLSLDSSLAGRNPSLSPGSKTSRCRPSGRFEYGGFTTARPRKKHRGSSAAPALPEAGRLGLAMRFSFSTRRGRHNRRPDPSPPLVSPASGSLRKPTSPHVDAAVDRAGAARRGPLCCGTCGRGSPASTAVMTHALDLAARARAPTGTTVILGGCTARFPGEVVARAVIDIAVHGEGEQTASSSRAVARSRPSTPSPDRLRTGHNHGQREAASIPNLDDLPVPVHCSHGSLRRPVLLHGG